ncbi:MAG: hypothetical protein AABY18_07595 [Candidatus Thermoplasmatota archaeon]
MRGAAWTLSILLLLVPLGLAEDGEGDSSSSSSTSSSGSPSSGSGSGPCADEDSPEEREQCVRDARERCAEHPDDERCAAPANRTEADDARLEGDGCRDGESDDEAADHCERAVRAIGDERGRDWISFRVDAPNATLLDYTIAGDLALEELRLDLDDGNLSIDRQGSTLRVRDGEAELRLHDEPNGLIRFKGADGNVTLRFPADAVIERGDHGARINYAGGRQGHLLADNATWLGNATVQLNGFFAFHMPPAGASSLDHSSPEREEAEERKQEAIERGHVGAEITLKPRPLQAAAAAAGPAGNDSVQILAYDDVEVEVDLPEAGSEPGAPLRVVVSSELDEGRTIVLNVDADLLASTDPAGLVLHYFDLHNQTDGRVLETEVVFVAASSLQDVLDPADDGGSPEYWVVEDANGVQVLVSVPHWSAHAITVSSVLSGLDAPSVLVGISVGVAMTVGLSVGLLRPRRRDDDL